MPEFDFDLAVVGSGPAGHHAAIQGAKLRKRVIMIERKALVGGICVNVGTIPSKTMREAIMYLSGYREHAVYGDSYRVKEKITFQDLLVRVDPVVRHEIDVLRHQLLRNGVELTTASASFVDPHVLHLEDRASGLQRRISAANVVLAVGTQPARDQRTPLYGTCIFSSDDMMQLDELPRTLAVIDCRSVVGADAPLLAGADGPMERTIGSGVGVESRCAGSDAGETVDCCSVWAIPAPRKLFETICRSCRGSPHWQ